MAVNFTEWLEDPQAIRCVLVEAAISVGGVAVTRYLSSKNYADSVAGRVYDPIVSSDSINLVERMSVDGQPSMSFGDVELINLDGSIDSWLRDIWVNKNITILIGDVRWLREDFVTIFNGTIEDIDSRSSGTLNIKVRDKLQRLNTPISEARLGGVSANKNELIPLCFGECFNVTPLLSNPATLEYRVHTGSIGASAIEGVIEVRDNGVPVSFAYVESLVKTRFTLSAQPFGQVTCSVQGVNDSSTWINTPSKIIKKIVKEYGGVNKFVDADIDLTQLSTFDTANPQPVGVYVESRENTLTVCNQLASSVGAQLVMSRLGKLQLLKIELPPSGTPFAIGETDIIANSLNVTNKFPVQAAFKVNYVKNWTVQTGLLTGIPAEHKKMYASEYASVTAEDVAVKADYALDTEPVAVDTLLLKESDAIAEATRLLSIFRNPIVVVSFTGHARLAELTLGQAVTITYPRFGFDAGVTGQVVGLSIDYSNLTVNADVLMALTPNAAPLLSRIMREDGSFLLREDGTYILREDA